MVDFVTCFSTPFTCISHLSSSSYRRAGSTSLSPASTTPDIFHLCLRPPHRTYFNAALRTWSTILTLVSNLLVIFADSLVHHSGSISPMPATTAPGCQAAATESTNTLWYSYLHSRMFSLLYGFFCSLTPLNEWPRGTWLYILMSSWS